MSQNVNQSRERKEGCNVFINVTLRVGYRRNYMSVKTIPL